MNINMFKSLDFFSPPVELNIAGDSNFKTFQGLMFTAVYSVIMIVVIYWTSEDYFRTDMPSSIYDAFQRSQYPRVNLTNSKLLPIFFGYSTEVDMIPSNDYSKYFTFSTVKVSWVTTTGANGEIGLEKRIKEFKSGACSDMPAERLKPYEYMGKDNYVYQMIGEYGICIQDDQDFYVEGKGSDELFEVVTFRVMPCTLADNTQCATPQEMAKANFVLALPSSNVDATNFENPQSYVVMADDIYYINPNIRQLYTTKIRENQVLDYLGLVTQEWKERTKFYDIASIFVTQGFRDPSQLSCTAADARDPNSSCMSYFELSLQSSGTVGVLRRSYITLTSVFGDIGGINGIVSFFMIILYQPINNYLRMRFLRRQLYSFIDHDNKGNSKRNTVSPFEDEKREPQQRQDATVSASNQPSHSSIPNNPLEDSSQNLKMMSRNDHLPPLGSTTGNNLVLANPHKDKIFEKKSRAKREGKV
jgi:hypothetical protein